MLASFALRAFLRDPDLHYNLPAWSVPTPSAVPSELESTTTGAPSGPSRRWLRSVVSHVVKKVLSILGFRRPSPRPSLSPDPRLCTSLPAPPHALPFRQGRDSLARSSAYADSGAEGAHLAMALVGVPPLWPSTASERDTRLPDLAAGLLRHLLAKSRKPMNLLHEIGSHLTGLE